MTDDTTTSDCPNCGSSDPAVFYDSESNYDAGEVPVEDAEACSECFANDECPDRCNEPHDEPEPNYNGQWSCPTTGETFRCDGDNSYLDWSVDTYNDGSVQIGGYWYSDPYDQGWTTCCACGEWVHEDDARWDDDGGFCDECFTEQGAACPGHAECAVCYVTLDAPHFDTVSERTYCTTHAPSRTPVKVLAAA